MSPPMSQPLRHEPQAGPSRLAEAKAAARSHVCTLDDDRRLPFAQAFTGRVVGAWWAAQCLRTGAAVDIRAAAGWDAAAAAALPDHHGQMADAAGAALAAVPDDDALYEAGLLYTSLLPADVRSAFGVYYTPPRLVDRLLTQVEAAGIDWTRATVLDPACGGGAFLAPVARRMLRTLRDVPPALRLRHVQRHLVGWEIDGFAGWLSQVALDAVLLPDIAAAAAPHLPNAAAGATLPAASVAIGNSLFRTAKPPAVDLVVGNPPYGRIALNPEQRAAYRRSVYGHANQYGLFLDLALQCCRPGGLIAYVTPTSFLSGEYFKNLRKVLTATTAPRFVEFVAARRGVFDDVLQETMLATFETTPGKTAPGGSRAIEESGSRQPAQVSLLHANDLQTLRVEPVGEFHYPHDSAPWFVPRSAGQQALFQAMETMPHRLGDWGYRVSTGPLVWNRRKDRLRTRPGRGHLPLLWSECVATDGAFVFRSTRKTHQPYFAVEPRDGVLITQDSCVLVQRTTAKEQPRRLIAAVLPQSFLDQHGGAVVENHLNMVRARGDQPAVPLRTVAAFLNSATADTVFRCISGSVAVSAYELEALPLPPPQAMAQITALIDTGATAAAIDAAIAELYQATEVPA